MASFTSVKFSVKIVDTSPILAMYANPNPSATTPINIHVTYVYKLVVNSKESMNSANIVPIEPIPLLQGVSVSSLNPWMAIPDRNAAHTTHNILPKSASPIAHEIPIRK